MKKIIIFLFILFSGVYGTHVYSFEKAKGALLAGLSAYCYTQLPSLFSWVKHPGKLYCKNQSLTEHKNGETQWIITLVNSEGHTYTITILLQKETVGHTIFRYTNKLLSVVVNSFYAYGTSLNSPAFTLHTLECDNKHLLRLKVGEETIAEHSSSQCYRVESNITIENSFSIPTIRQWFYSTGHASGLGMQNMCKLACIIVGSYGCTKLMGIL